MQYSNQGNADIDKLLLEQIKLLHTIGDVSFSHGKLPKGKQFIKKIPIKPTALGHIVYQFDGQDVSGNVQNNPVYGYGRKQVTILVNPRES